VLKFGPIELGRAKLSRFRRIPEGTRYFASSMTSIALISA